MTNKEVKKLIMEYIVDHKPITSYVEHKAFLMVMEALEKIEHNCGNCVHHNNYTYWCDERVIDTDNDMSCTDWSDGE